MRAPTFRTPAATHCSHAQGSITCQQWAHQEGAHLSKESFFRVVWLAARGHGAQRVGTKHGALAPEQNPFALHDRARARGDLRIVAATHAGLAGTGDVRSHIISQVQHLFRSQTSLFKGRV